MRYYELVESYANIDKTVRNLVLLQLASYHLKNAKDDVSSANMWAKPADATMQYLEHTIAKMYPGVNRLTAMFTGMDDAELNSSWNSIQQSLRKEYSNTYKNNLKSKI